MATESPNGARAEESAKQIGEESAPESARESDGESGTVEESAGELARMYADFPTQTLKSLYLAERERRLTVRSQLAVPASVISFALFGYISFARNFDVGQLDQPLTASMLGLFGLSMLLLLIGAGFLARLEVRFMIRQLTYDETPAEGQAERDYLIDRYTRFTRLNDKAANDRACAFLLILGGLVVFVLLVALLPFHLAAGGGG